MKTKVMILFVILLLLITVIFIAKHFMDKSLVDKNGMIRDYTELTVIEDRQKNTGISD